MIEDEQLFLNKLLQKIDGYKSTNSLMLVFIIKHAIEERITKLTEMEIIIEELGFLSAGDCMMITWSAIDATHDIMIWPSVATDMTVEYMIFS